MKNAHDYKPDCACFRCKGIRNDPRHKTPSKRKKTQSHHGKLIATREEQHARYLDCGPGAWDDR